MGAETMGSFFAAAVPLAPVCAEVATLLAAEAVGRAKLPCMESGKVIGLPPQQSQHSRLAETLYLDTHALAVRRQLINALPYGRDFGSRSSGVFSLFLRLWIGDLLSNSLVS